MCTFHVNFLTGVKVDEIGEYLYDSDLLLSVRSNITNKSERVLN